MTLILDEVRAKLIGLKLSHLWRGHGSALFLEFGDLSPSTRRDGSPGAPEGEFGVMIEWSWRIETRQSILCGSDSDAALWQTAFAQLIGRSVMSLSTFGRLPELAIGLSDDIHVSSFMTAEGDPAWCVFDRRHDGEPVALHCREGTIVRGR